MADRQGKPFVKLSELSDGTPSRGLRCRKCGCNNFAVDRTVRAAGFIQRERTCRNCGNRLNTREIACE